MMEGVHRARQRAVETILGQQLVPGIFMRSLRNAVLIPKTLTMVVALCFVAVVVMSIEVVNAAALVVYEGRMRTKLP